MLRAAVLVLCALPALAHAVTWTRAGVTSDSRVFIDKASIRKDDGGRRAWTLESFRKPQTAPDGKQYLSVKALHLYDCQERNVTLQSQSFYPEPMAKGEAVGTYKFEAFDAEQVAPDSRYAAAMNAVCGRAVPGTAPAAKPAP
ncbi:MAG TPA: surface-adhesin E family protein [Pseudoduganella sp.]|jgi:hypothetical protein